VGHGEAARVRRNSRFRESASLVSDSACHQCSDLALPKPPSREAPSCAETVRNRDLRGNFGARCWRFCWSAACFCSLLFCGWLYAGTSGAVITTVLGAIALMLMRKVSPQLFLLLGGARSIGSEDMPALFGIVATLCRRAGIAQVPKLYFLPFGVPTAFATGVGDQSVIVVSSGLLRLLMTVS